MLLDADTIDYQFTVECRAGLSPRAARPKYTWVVNVAQAFSPAWGKAEALPHGYPLRRVFASPDYWSTSRAKRSTAVGSLLYIGMR